MTLTDAAYNLLNTLRGGRSSNSDVVSVEQIKFNILYYRALLVKRDEDRRSGFLSPLEQEIPVEIDAVDPLFPLSGGSVLSTIFYDGARVSLARSLRPLPKPLPLKSREALSYAGRPDGGAEYPFVNYHAAVPLLYSRYTALYKTTFLMGGYLYLMNPDLEAGETELLVRGVFEDPRKAHNFSVDERAAIDKAAVSLAAYWDDDKNEFPCPMDLYQRIEQSLLSGSLRLLKAEPDPSLNEQP